MVFGTKDCRFESCQGQRLWETKVVGSGRVARMCVIFRHHPLAPTHLHTTTKNHTPQPSPCARSTAACTCGDLGAVAVLAGLGVVVPLHTLAHVQHTNATAVACLCAMHARRVWAGRHTPVCGPLAHPTAVYIIAPHPPAPTPCVGACRARATPPFPALQPPPPPRRSPCPLPSQPCTLTFYTAQQHRVALSSRQQVALWPNG